MTDREKLVLGQRVRFRAVLEREKKYNGPVRWIAQPVISGPVDGVYIGTRTVFDGTHNPGGPEDPGYLSYAHGVSHAIVVTHPRRAPVRVPWDALEAM